MARRHRADAVRQGDAVLDPARLGREGFGDNLVTGASNYNKDIFAARGTIEFEPSSAFSIRVSGDYTDDQSAARNGHRLIVGQLSGAPILDQAVAYLDCEVRESVVVGEHTLFLGEVVDAGFQKPEDTPVLRMEDTRMNYGG